MADIEKVKQGLRCCNISRVTCFKDGNDELCPYFDTVGDCNFELRKDALSVIKHLTTNEGAIDVLHKSGWMQNHDKEMSEDGTFFVMWLSELMMHTDDEPIKPSEIIDRIKEGGFRRFVDDFLPPKEGDG